MKMMDKNVIVTNCCGDGRRTMDGGQMEDGRWESLKENDH